MESCVPSQKKITAYVRVLGFHSQTWTGGGGWEAGREERQDEQHLTGREERQGTGASGGGSGDDVLGDGEWG
jgi:hypothetical protein